MLFPLFTPLIESALLKMLLEVERSWPQFMNLNELRTKRNEFLRLSFFNHVLARLCYRLVAGPKAKCVKRTWSIIYNFGLKIQLVDRIFFARRKNISCALCTRKIGNLSTRRCVLGSMTATAHVKSSWVAVTDFKTRVLVLKPEVQILGSSKSIRQTKVEILRLKSCFLRKKETKLHANLWKTFSNELFCWRSWLFHVKLFSLMICIGRVNRVPDPVLAASHAVRESITSGA